MEMRNVLKVSLLAALLVGVSACDKTDRSFSLLAGGQSFQQTAVYVPRKIDILWVVDNSGSMDSSQTALTSNFRSFIDRFKTLNYDFHMAVQSTDAYLGKFNNQQTRRRVKDGAGTTHSGVFVIDKDTPNIDNVFLTNAKLGINGSGDERAFSSFEDTLDYTGNADFRRPDAYLAIIIVSDEDDFSATTSAYLHENYNSANLIPVSHYVDFLNTLTTGPKDYSVNAITILDQACLDNLNASSPGRRFGLRYQDLVTKTGGTVGSLCSNFGDTLALISNNIIQLVSEFKLDREPIVETIRVTVDGVVIPQDANNGWSYDSATWTISFASSVTPPQGSNVQITFDPTTIK